RDSTSKIPRYSRDPEAQICPLLSLATQPIAPPFLLVPVLTSELIFIQPRGGGIQEGWDIDKDFRVISIDRASGSKDEQTQKIEESTSYTTSYIITQHPRWFLIVCQATEEVKIPRSEGAIKIDERRLQEERRRN
ncbi:hypothetical protein LINGRAHAP2_LOCUS11068, partial [Linum grandiflorum]